MADQAITALPKKTYSGSSQIASTDYLLGIDSAEGYQMLIQDLGEYIINKATANLAGSTQTLAYAISALNSKTVQNDKGGSDAADYLQIGFDASDAPEIRVHNKINNTWYHESLAPLNQSTNIKTLNSNFACVSLGSVGSEAKTVASTDWVDIITVSNINLPAGKYMFIATVNATWSVSGYQFFPGIRVDSNNASSLYNYALPQTNQPVMVMGYLNVSGGTHTISLIGRVTNASKEVTIPAYQNIGIVFIHCA